jgi:DNA (cytosine-5)-methyltransferase 1
MGLERAGLGHTVWQVERDEYCRRVLARHWPDAERFDDVCTFHPPTGVDVVCGGFPCQPWSVAGKRREHEDERHLWPEFARIVEEARPAIVVGENVPGLRARGLRIVLADLARLGFDVEWTCLSAADVGAPHLRRRLFIVATHPERIKLRVESGRLSRTNGSSAPLAAEHGRKGAVADSDGQGQLQQGWLERAIGRWACDCRESLANPHGETRRSEARDAVGGDGREEVRAGQEEPGRRGDALAVERGGSSWHAWATEPDVGRVAHGVPARVDRLRALGNAVVPQVSEVIGRAVVAATEEVRT